MSLYSNNERKRGLKRKKTSVLFKIILKKNERIDLDLIKNLRRKISKFVTYITTRYNPLVPGVSYYASFLFFEAVTKI